MIGDCGVRFSQVSGLKTAPFLGRKWTDSNTPYTQMDEAIVGYYSRAPSQSRYSALATFEVKLHCCGVNAPEDYSAKYAKPETCLPGATLPSDAATGGNSTTPPSPAAGNSTAPATNSSGRAEPATSAAPAPAGTAPPANGSSEAGNNSSSTDGPGPGAPPAGGQRVDRPGCRERVWSLWEGSKVAFDATISAMTFSIMTALLTVAWCELWGEGLISGIECCKEETKKKSKRKS